MGGFSRYRSPPSFSCGGAIFRPEPPSEGGPPGTPRNFRDPPGTPPPGGSPPGVLGHFRPGSPPGSTKIAQKSRSGGSIPPKIWSRWPFYAHFRVKIDHVSADRAPVINSATPRVVLVICYQLLLHISTHRLQEDHGGSSHEF